MLTLVKSENDRPQTKINVTPEARAVIARHAKFFDMKKEGVASRIYETFALLPMPLQKWMLGLSDFSEAEAVQRLARFAIKHAKNPAISEEVAADAIVTEFSETAREKARAKKRQRQSESSRPQNHSTPQP